MAFHINFDWMDDMEKENKQFKFDPLTRKMFEEITSDHMEKYRKLEDEKVELVKMPLEYSTPCVRCGDTKRQKSEGERAGQSGFYCTDVWSCEWDVWSLPCCQYCHEQFNPSVHLKCELAPIDPFGNGPHIPGGKFLTSAQKDDQAETEVEEKHPRKLSSEEMQVALEEFKRVSEEIKKTHRAPLTDTLYTYKGDYRDYSNSIKTLNVNDYGIAYDKYGNMDPYRREA